MAEEQNTNQVVEPKKKKKTWLIIVAVIAVIIIGGAAASGGDKESKGVSTKETVKTDDKSKDNNKSEEKTDTYKKGEVCKTDNLKISFLDCGTFTKYDSYAKPDKGKKIISAEFEFENISDSDEVLDTFECYADGSKCDSYFWSGEDVLTFESLSKGRKVKGKVFFQVPKKAKSIELEYETNAWTSDKITFVVK